MGHVERFLLISGSLRERSTNTALLRTAELLPPPGLVTSLYEGMATLPHFNPDDDVDPLPPAVADLRARIRAADALVFSTPEYAGALPGSFKNLLDWAVGDGEPGSIYQKPVAWWNASASATGAAHAHESLRRVLGYLNADIVEEACLSIPVARSDVGDDGLIWLPDRRQLIASALARLVRSLDAARKEPARPAT